MHGGHVGQCFFPFQNISTMLPWKCSIAAGSTPRLHHAVRVRFAPGISVPERSSKPWVAGWHTYLKTRRATVDTYLYGCFQKYGYPKMDGLYWKTLLKWMIWRYHHLRNHPYVGITTIVLQLRKWRGSFRTFKKRVLEIFFAIVGFLEDVWRWLTGSNLCGSSPILCHQLPRVGKPRAATTRPMTLQGNWDSWLYNFFGGEGMSCICPQLPPQGWAHKFMLGHWNSQNQLGAQYSNQSDRDDTRKNSLGSPSGSWFFIVSNWSNERTQVPCE